MLLLMCLCLSIYFVVCAVSDLAPGQMGIDDMKMLEQKAQQLAAEAEQDKPKPKEKILFVRYVLSFFYSSENNLWKFIKLDYVFQRKWRHTSLILCICLCRSDTSRSELAELAKQANPDEIDIDDDENDDDEDQGPDGEWRTQQALPQQ